MTKSNKLNNAGRKQITINAEMKAPLPNIRPNSATIWFAETKERMKPAEAKIDAEIIIGSKLSFIANITASFLENSFLFSK